ncbi:CoA transferase subunit A [Rubrobacter taiwanensis]|jgi:3-oxoacid CoA-transferase A subunit|uniref:CoA transferase subunit A n=1 Tax=Rubrobacter taiwanensis TaxID=185139 RepID=A0A4R1BFS8_9ACTN|nr:CoA transferase subunit A [Rubrobacter taiwanensis]TCJ16003.1 CoA transferase subunit A [Rubrobacter taiwanensis]
MVGSELISAEEAAALVGSGSTVMVGGFGLVGTPLTILEALVASPGVRDLTTISNNVGEPGKGLGKLLLAGKIRRVIGSYFTSNPDVLERYGRGELEVRLVPQGTLAEAIRAGGAGIGGFYTRTGVGSELAEGREVREIDGQLYLFEKPLRADIALIRAHRADALGNLTYYKTARNFNPEMATAADVVVAEVDEIVGAGELDPEHIVTPHLYVDYLVRAEITLRSGPEPLLDRTGGG